MPFTLEARDISKPLLFVKDMTVNITPKNGKICLTLTFLDIIIQAVAKIGTFMFFVAIAMIF